MRKVSASPIDHVLLATSSLPEEIDRAEAMRILKCDKKEIRRLKKRGALERIGTGKNGAHLYRRSTVLALALERSARREAREARRAAKAERLLERARRAPRPGLAKGSAGASDQAAATRIAPREGAAPVVPRPDRPDLRIPEELANEEAPPLRSFRPVAPQRPRPIRPDLAIPPECLDDATGTGE